MSRMKKGNGLLRFLIFAVLSALVLTGCNGTRKYEAVDLSSETAAVSETAEPIRLQRRTKRIQQIPVLLVPEMWTCGRLGRQSGKL